MTNTEPEQHQQQHGSQEFIADPSGHTLAILDERQQAAALEQRLHDAGIQEVRRYVGPDGAHAIDSAGVEHGIPEQAVRTVQRALTNKDNLAEYEGALAQGAAVIAFRTPDDDREAEVLALLDQFGARAVNAFGTAVVRTLKP